MKKLVLVFLIVVLAFSTVGAFTSTAKLSWTPPATFVDGVTLIPSIDLTGYRVYSGTSSGVYGTPVLVSGGTATTVTVTINAGTTYFAVSAVGVNGLESAKSNEGSKTVSAPSPGACVLTVQ
jgi:hypothetical protein